MEGELPEDGLAAYGDDGDDLMMALARKIVTGEQEEDEGDTVEEAFAQARNAASEAKEYLVDDGWKAVEVKQEAVAANGNGHNPNGYDDLFGPTVELERVNGNGPNGNGNGHSTVPVNGNGANGNHYDETEGPKQSLFSWAEFMAEPVKPKRRSRKPQPASISMFEWAMELEMERETVGAGR